MSQDRADSNVASLYQRLIDTPHDQEQIANQLRDHLIDMRRAGKPMSAEFVVLEAQLERISGRSLH